MPPFKSIIDQKRESPAVETIEHESPEIGTEIEPDKTEIFMEPEQDGPDMG